MVECDGQEPEIKKPQHQRIKVHIATTQIQKSPGFMPGLEGFGLTSRIIPTYRRPLATRPVARNIIDVSAFGISNQCLKGHAAAR